MGLSEHLPNIIPFSPDGLGHFFHQNVPHAEIPMGSIVCSPETERYYHKESGSTYRLLIHSTKQEGFIKDRLIDESSLPAKFHIVSLPSPDQVVRDPIDRLHEGQEIDARRIDGIQFVVRDQLKMLHNLGVENAEGTPTEIFRVGKFSTIPEGSRVMHPLRKILMTKRGEYIEQRFSQDQSFMGKIPPNAEVQYLPPTSRS